MSPQALLDCPLIVCVGCGGVGKTTVAAALALEGARRGRRALVLTIDPAQRLADALGVEALGNRPEQLPRAALAAVSVPETGSLSALMLDMKRTFDDLVERFAAGEEARERIFRNPIYRHVSEALAGSVEFAAMEKVYEMWESGDYDLMVVDTPPAQHALDFLDAPQRLLEFLESRLAKALIHPAFAAGRFGFRLFQQSTRRVLQLMERVSGFAFLEDLSEFLLAFEEMSAGFRQRASRVRALLLGPRTAFVLVTGPARETLREADYFRERLSEQGVEPAGVVVNRIRLWPEAGAPPEGTPPDADLASLGDALAAAWGPEFDAPAAARAAVAATTGYAALVRRDARAIAGLQDEARARGIPFCRVPELAEDVHDLGGLARVARAIFDPQETAGGQGI